MLCWVNPTLKSLMRVAHNLWITLLIRVTI